MCGQDGLHLLAQARCLQYAALIDGLQHDGIELVRPGQREQALGGFLHAGKALAERIDDRLEAPGQAVDLDFHRVQLILILLERLFPHGVVGGGGLAFLLGCFGFRLKFGRRGFGVLPSPFLGLLLGLGLLFGLGFGFGLKAGLFLGFLFGLLFSFEFGFFLVRQGVFAGGLAGGRVSRFLAGRGRGVLAGSGEQGLRGKACAQQPGHHEQGEAPERGSCEKTL